jgi:hypothetical protein
MDDPTEDGRPAHPADSPPAPPPGRYTLPPYLRRYLRRLPMAR